MPDFPEFIRSLVGLDRKAAQIAFNHALALLTLSAEQIRFVEMIIGHPTSSGRMEPELLYVPSFTDRAPNGVSDVFDAATVEAVLDLLEEMNPRLAASVCCVIGALMISLIRSRLSVRSKPSKL